MLARNQGSEIPFKYVSKWLELLTEVFNKDKKKLTSIFLLIFVHVGSPALLVYPLQLKNIERVIGMLRNSIYPYERTAILAPLRVK